MNKQKMDKWPNFFIVGAPRAGTTSLHAYLSVIPGILMSSVKEPNFFSKKLVPDNHPLLNPIREKEQYLHLFQNVSKQKIYGEASPLYLSDPDAPKLIHQVSPKALILISLRDPIERILSHYTLIIRDGGTKESFHDVLKNEMKYGIQNSIKPHLYIESGLYADSVKRYFEIFGQNQVKIIIFEEFSNNPKNTLKEILNFLGIPYSLSNFKAEIHNPFTAARGKTAEYLLTSKIASKFVKNVLPSSTRRYIRRNVLTKQQNKPTLDEKDWKILYDYYKEDVEKVKKLLKRELPWANFKS